MTICDVKRKEIVRLARNCVGSPFRHQGRDPACGLDCVGLIIHVAKSLGLGEVDYRNYSPVPGKEVLSHHAIRAGYVRRPLSEIIPGNIAILRLGRTLDHAAIISDLGISGRGLIHACETYGKVVEHGLNRVWQKRVIAVYAFPSHEET